MVLVNKKKAEKFLLMIVLLILIAALIFVLVPKTTVYVIQRLPEQVQLYFYDGITNCSLDGYLFIGDKLIGKTNKGLFNLTLKNYLENFNNNSNISLFGKLGDCFGRDLFFDKTWKAPEIEEYYFRGESLFNFKTEIEPNNPVKRELIGFIQPEKIKSELAKINLKKRDIFEDLSKINNYLNDQIDYVKDWEFNKVNYWQEPPETIKKTTGDCEDFSSTLLSLFLVYNSSLNCYNVILSSHVTTFCFINSSYVYYDQGRTELKEEIKNKNSLETKSKLRELNQEYLEHYGINQSADQSINQSTRAYFAFNRQGYWEFKSEDEFVNWQYSLKEQKYQNILETLEKEYQEIQEKIENEPINETGGIIGEFATQKQELPTIKGFLKENLILIISSSLIILILFAILIWINLRKIKVLGLFLHIFNS